MMWRPQPQRVLLLVGGWLFGLPPSRAELSWQSFLRTGLSDTAIGWLIGFLLVGLPVLVGWTTAYVLRHRHPGGRSSLGLSVLFALLAWWVLFYGLGQTLPEAALLPLLLLGAAGAAAGGHFMSRLPTQSG